MLSTHYARAVHIYEQRMLKTNDGLYGMVGTRGPPLFLTVSRHWLLALMLHPIKLEAPPHLSIS